MKKILVVPSNREKNFNSFLKAWELVSDWDEIILVEDNPTKTFDVDISYHYSWKEIEEDLVDNSWIISKSDSAIRSYGFLKAYQQGADYVLTLDDDCYPYNITPIFQSHIDKITNTPKWTESVQGMRTRGIPYLNKGKLDNVVANMGLWTKIPDLDSIQSLSNLNMLNGNFKPSVLNRIIPQGQYFPLCGMNVCFSRSIIPLTYFPLMGQDSPYRRFDDIWFGIIFKKILDHLNLLISVGEPFVEHQRASDVMVNLVKEAPGIAMNERFWNIIDGVCLAGCSNPYDSMFRFGFELRKEKDEYIKKLGNAIVTWIYYFKE